MMGSTSDNSFLLKTLALNLLTLFKLEYTMLLKADTLKS